MKKDKVRAHCPRCRHQQVFVRATINHWLHFALAIVTCGLWLVSWLALCVGKVMRPWRCEHCNWHKPEFGRIGAADAQPAKPDKPARSRRPGPAVATAPILGAQTSQLRP